MLIDGPVSPVQQRNLEKAWKVKILDRTGLILEIFSDRARTREGVLQVEMAALSYQRTRLVRAWTHLERQRGGLGFVGGPGETQIEADRRAIDEQLARLRKQLAKVVKTRELHRAARAKVPFPVVALVGYTNAGKSTLFNRMTGADVMVKDMLFATLDPTMRGVDPAVGAQGDPVRHRGLHLRSADTSWSPPSAPRWKRCWAPTSSCMCATSRPKKPRRRPAMSRRSSTSSASSREVPRIEVWNKTDRLDAEARAARETEAARNADVVATSALTGAGVDGLTAAIEAHLARETTRETPAPRLRPGPGPGLAARGACRRVRGPGRDRLARSRSTGPGGRKRSTPISPAEAGASPRLRQCRPGTAGPGGRRRADGAAPVRPSHGRRARTGS